MSDELLIVLSRRGQVAWPTCRRYIQELYARLEGGGPTPRHLETVAINSLQSLGHAMVDYTDGSGVVRVAPRVLARLPMAGRPTAVLVGHRTADISEAFLERCVGVPGAIATTVDGGTEWPFIPRRLCVETDSQEDLQAIATAVEALFDPEPASWRVLQVASTVESYGSLLQWRTQRDLNWERRDFDVVGLRWVASGSTGDGLAEFTDPQTGRRRYRLRRADRVADVDRPWGCYVILAATRRLVLYYDSGTLLAPLNARLPAPFDTALTLCSGLAPQVVSVIEYGRRSPFLRYYGIPWALAALAATKLGQQLVALGQQEPTP